jgi:hypothetical protein
VLGSGLLPRLIFVSASVPNATSHPGHADFRFMRSGRPLIEWALLAVICTAVVFLFPATAGPFSVVHGPATALRAWNSALAILMGIALAASAVLALKLKFHASCRWLGEFDLVSATPSTLTLCILRC